jgi:hypothetical protein
MCEKSRRIFNNVDGSVDWTFWAIICFALLYAAFWDGRVRVLLRRFWLELRHFCEGFVLCFLESVFFLAKAGCGLEQAVFIGLNLQWRNVSGNGR